MNKSSKIGIFMILLFFSNIKTKAVLSLSPNEDTKSSGQIESESMHVAEVLTSYFQSNLKENYTHMELETIREFLRTLIKIRNRAYQAPQYWHSRQGRNSHKK